jgi:hypothetical protein
MTKTAFVLTTAGILALACVALPRPAEAWRGYYAHGYYSHCPQPGYGKYYNCGRFAVPGYPRYRD